MLRLVIANKNYSSWSMRPWLVLKHFGIEFEEIKFSLNDPEWASKVGRYSPALKVPVLMAGEFPVWETLAIIECLAEKFTEFEIWPGAPKPRARARSICAEMHAGFHTLRNHWPMNISADLPGHPGDAAVAKDLKRICDLWQETLAASGGPFLFGRFCAADAMFAPVVMRFHTYHVELPVLAQRYCDRVRSDHAVAEWVAGALLEDEYVADDEPYRGPPGKT